MGTETFPAETMVAQPVALPAVSAPALADLVQRMLGGEPAARERIQRGVAVLLSGALHATAELGVYHVDGCEGRTYTTSSASCDCPDSVNRGVTCKHQWAARLLSAMSAAARWERLQARYELTAKGLAATTAPGLRGGRLAGL